MSDTGRMIMKSRRGVMLEENAPRTAVRPQSLKDFEDLLIAQAP